MLPAGEVSGRSKEVELLDWPSQERVGDAARETGEGGTVIVPRRGSWRVLERLAGDQGRCAFVGDGLVRESE